MLDKNIFLQTLIQAKKETIDFTQQTVGKTDLIDTLIRNIQSGNYDYNPKENIASEENVTVSE